MLKSFRCGPMRSAMDVVKRSIGTSKDSSNSLGERTLIEGNRYSVGGLGVFREDEVEDIQFMVDNFTAPALARAVRERENILQRAAQCINSENTMELTELLGPYSRSNLENWRNKKLEIDFSGKFTRNEIATIQRFLNRMPRMMSAAHASNQKRASVVIPLCNDNGVASILFERRSETVRTHKQQVCFPGGMVDREVDSTIIETSLRELEEELGFPAAESTEVLGILRCDWNEVANMTGIAVTPVVGFLGDLKDLPLRPNPDEVSELFTIKISDLLVDENWVKRDFSAPIFKGGPHVIWGLTGYLLEKFLNEVIRKCL